MNILLDVYYLFLLRYIIYQYINIINILIYNIYNILVCGSKGNSFEYIFFVQKSLFHL